MSAKRVNDVEPPGNSAPSDTSRPVIVTNRPILKDPMMVADKNSEAGEATSSEPVTETEQSSENKPDKAITYKPKQTIKALNPTKPSALEPSASSDTKTSEPDLSGDQATEPNDNLTKSTDKEDSAKEPSDKELEEAAEKQAKHDDNINQLVESKRYFLSINAVEKRKTKHFVILGVVLSLLLVLLWADIALDAGLIKINGVKAPTHFFSN